MNRKLVKSPNNVVFAGVLAGIGEFLRIDPTIIRVVYVLLSVFSGGFPLFILYIAMAIIIPSGRNNTYHKNYDHNDYYGNQNHPYGPSSSNRKKTEKVDDDDWSDF